MARNVEIKARIESVEALTPRAAALADHGPIAIVQDDTFFACPNGRLKLRTFSATDGQLIFYRRPDQAGPKESFFLISPTSSPSSKPSPAKWPRRSRARHACLSESHRPGSFALKKATTAVLSSR